MELDTIMFELEVLGTEQTRKIFKNHGALEPIFGVNSKPLKNIAKKIKKNHNLALALYATGNYDAQYLAGMVAEPAKMSKAEIV